MQALPWCTGHGVWYRPMPMQPMHVWPGPEGSYYQSGFVPLKRVAKSASWYNYDPYFSCKIGMWSLFKIFSNLSLNWPPSYSWILGEVFKKFRTSLKKFAKLCYILPPKIQIFGIKMDQNFGETWYKNGSTFKLRAVHLYPNQSWPPLPGYLI